MTLADSHVKALLKEGTARAGSPPTGAEWRVSPEAIEAAKGKAEEYLRMMGEMAARKCGGNKRSTLRSDDITEVPPDAQSGPG